MYFLNICVFEVKVLTLLLPENLIQIEFGFRDFSSSGFGIIVFVTYILYVVIIAIHYITVLCIGI